MSHTAQQALKQYFGFPAFREPQGAIVEAVLAGRDTLVIMPTGGGKSLCYQLPAMLLPGVTVVVSPLIALMKDQVDALIARGVPAATINSAQTFDEQREVFRKIRQGQIKLVYIAPERFRGAGFSSMLASVEVSLFAIDEAHCLSQWGHDFRPDYLRLADAVDKLGHRPPLIALTATATPEVRDDIVKQLRLRDPQLYVAGFARKNLRFVVNAISPGSSRAKDSLFTAKIARIKELVREHRTGIIYCATRKSVERVSAELGNLCVAYHAGMDDKQRTEAQERFMRGNVPVAVATNAFGMGIDRADIRFVVHYEMPGSVEAYYQEAGRAGRDGKPAHCEMLFNYADRRVQEFFIEGTNPDKDTVSRVYATLKKLAAKDPNHEVHVSIDDLAETVEKQTGKVNPMAVGTALSVLARQHVIERFDIPGKRIRGTRLLRPDAPDSKVLAFDWSALQDKRERDERKLNAVTEYAYARTCRQTWILNYFGETDAPPCECCDICELPENACRRVPDDVELTIVRKALSGVARMSQKISGDNWMPKFGRTRIIECLLGAENDAMRKSGLQILTTYGILRTEGKSYLMALFREMQSAGLLKTVEKVMPDGGKLPLCGLTELGAKVMRGVASFRMEWPPRGHEFTNINYTKRAATASHRRHLILEDAFDKTDIYGDFEEDRIDSPSSSFSYLDAPHREHPATPEKTPAARKKSSPSRTAKTGANKSGANASTETFLPDPDEEQTELLKKLRSVRADITKTKNTLPYIVMHNKGIESLAKFRPASVEAAIGLPGIGKAKRAILPQFLAVLQNHKGTKKKM